MTSRPDDSLSAIMSERRQLTGVAYRLLGSLAEAEDVVQETYTRWYALTPEQREAIETPGAWLTKVASRICLDVLGSARARRERYVGEWLPEPLPDGVWTTARPADDPADRVTLDESITMAFLVVLDSMTPAQRVAFVLHDVFGYPFADVADVVGRTPAACRQLATSARRRLKESRTPPSPRAEQADVVRRFKAAWEARDIGALVDLLDPNARAAADGGGLATAREPAAGADEVAHVCLDLATRGPSLTLRETTVNGRPGLTAEHEGVTVAVITFAVSRGRITHLWAMRNPEKLRPWTDG